jgi:two-component system sensor kinase FixL
MDQADSAVRQLTITTHLPTEDTVQVTVQDTGPGLHPDMLKYIFKPFQTTKTNGIGLGLAISHSIIEAHRGRLWAVPNADQGAIFHFTLPIPHQPAST